MIRRGTRDTLWTLIAPPAMWAIHFLICYVVAAVECSPNTSVFASIATTRLVIAAVTAGTLLLIGLVFFRAYREWSEHGGGTLEPAHAEDSDVGRERFLEFSTVLLAGLSFVSVVFTALPALVNVDCR